MNKLKFIVPILVLGVLVLVGAGCGGGGEIGSGEEGWVCGDTITFTYRLSPVTYGTVAHNAECWLDRNLGASQVANAYNDSEAYGDLFQRGRLDDGHQARSSEATTSLSTTDVPGHNNFIKAPDSPFDWRDGQNSDLWQGGANDNNPCPNGWRIPTGTEWETERASWGQQWGQQSYNGAYASPLKLPAGGYRDFSDASLSRVGSNGHYWSSTVDDTSASFLYFYGSSSSSSMGAGILSYRRAGGFSVRCIKG